MLTEPRTRPILRNKRINREPVYSGAFINSHVPVVPQLLEPHKRRDYLGNATQVFVIVDPTSGYVKTVWCAIGTSLANVAIGAVLMFSIYFAILTKDVHIAFCSFSHIFFMPEAIVALHYANGWTFPMRTRHKKIAHLVLQICGIFLALIGTACTFHRRGASSTAHCVTGILSVIMLIAAAIVGPIAWFFKRRWSYALHMSLGILAFVISSLCVLCGLALNSFRIWSGFGVFCTLFLFWVYYTMFILLSTFIKCVSTM